MKRALAPSGAPSRWLAVGTIVVAALATEVAFAQPAPAPSAPSPSSPSPSAPPSASGRKAATRAPCVENLPVGATRPKVRQELPKQGLSGYAIPLVVTIDHGRGESVLPEGFKLQRGSDAARALERAGFELPEVKGGAPPRLETQETPEGARTTVSIPLLLLPPEPGRHLLSLPPLPIAIARASGELMTICTSPHDVLVEDPTANESKPLPRPNPPPRPQREPWEELKWALAAIAGGLVLGTLVFWLLRRWSRRPRHVAPPVPVLPWIAALTELDRIRRSGQLAEGKTDEVFDLVSDCLRKYLGARYGFDGLETTTNEMKSLLRRVRPNVPELEAIGRFLDDCDLVKFARAEPTPDDCVSLLGRAESIVRWTTPPAAKDRPSGEGPKGPRPPKRKKSHAAPPEARP